MKELVTKDGYQKLWDRKRQLEKEIAKANFKRGETSGGGGGWHENNLFEYLEEELHHLTSRLYTVNKKLLNVKIVEEEPKNLEKISFGSSVEVELDGNRQKFTIMGEEEIDLLNGVISYKSPLGSALLDACAGEIVLVDLPSGKAKVKVIKVN